MLDQFIGQSQKRGALFDEPGSSLLGVAPGSGEAPDPSPLGGGHAVELVTASLTAGQDPNGVQFSPGAAASGFTALAAHEVKGAGHQGLLGCHGAQGAAEGAVAAPEALTEAGALGAHLCL